jgi:signal transduction histidine kinase
VSPATTLGSGRLRSLRRNLIVGAALWTVGFITAVTMVMVVFIERNQGLPRAIHGFFHHVLLSSIVSVSCMTAAVWYFRRGLSSVEHLRARLSAVHRGEDRHVSGHYASEVQPLVDDLNALLAERERRVQRALTKAGDLAHGLKTPLAVLSRDAECAAASGYRELAESLSTQVERMRRQIDYHLAQARAAGVAPGTRSLVAGSTEGLVRTLQQLHADRQIEFEVDISPSHAVRCQREDLEEMLGNLLDNACKWGTSRVRASSAIVTTSVVLTVEDDGPGIEPAMAAHVLQRGVRADERVPGSGLGLAIVNDLAELYGGSIELRRSELGGVSARLELPAA